MNIGSSNANGLNIPNGVTKQMRALSKSRKCNFSTPSYVHVLVRRRYFMLSVAYFVIVGVVFTGPFEYISLSYHIF